MGILKDAAGKVYDTEVIQRGYLVYAKHKSWPEGKAGFVTAVSEREIIVQYHPGIANVTNHFFVPASELAAGQWELKWTKDLSEVQEYGGE